MPVSCNSEGLARYLRCKINRNRYYFDSFHMVYLFPYFSLVLYKSMNMRFSNLNEKEEKSCAISD
jgi:hypothetical protein